MRASLFVKEEHQFRGAGPHVQRSLGMIDFDSPTITKLTAACKSLDLAYKVPVYRENCYAHVGLSNLRLGFFVTNSNDKLRTAREAALWKSYGWMIWGISVRSVETITVESLAANLERELKKIGKLK